MESVRRLVTVMVPGGRFHIAVINHVDLVWRVVGLRVVQGAVIHIRQVVTGWWCDLAISVWRAGQGLVVHHADLVYRRLR